MRKIGQELNELRKLVASFDEEKDKAVRITQEAITKELNERYEFEKRIRDQEFKSQLEVLNLRLNNALTENSRQAKEVEALKKALDEATRQVKEIAVKVIESGSSQLKSVTPSEI